MHDLKNWRLITLVTGHTFLGQVKESPEQGARRTVVEPAYTFLSNTQASPQGFGHFELAAPIQLRDGLKRVDIREEHIAFEVPITDEEWLKELLTQADRLTKELGEAMKQPRAPQGNGGPRILVPNPVLPRR